MAPQTEAIDGSRILVARRLCSLAMLVLAAISTMSCSDSPSAPTQDAVEVRSASPATTTTLTAGFEQTFTYVVRFTLTSNQAVAGLVLVPDGLLHLAEFSPVIPIGRGTTTATLTHRMLIPAGTRRFDVLIGLEAQDRISQTSTTLTYQVQ
jgi:hypothetical protein